MTTWMIVALSFALAGAGLGLCVKAYQLLAQARKDSGPPFDTPGDLAPPSSSSLTRRGFLPRLAFGLLAALAASRAARGEALPHAASFLAQSEDPAGPLPSPRGHVDVYGPGGSHEDTHADFAHSDYHDHSDNPHSDHADAPHSDHSDAPHSDHSDVPYADHSDVPHGDS